MSVGACVVPCTVVLVVHRELLPGKVQGRSRKKKIWELGGQEFQDPGQSGRQLKHHNASPLQPRLVVLHEGRCVSKLLHYHP